MSYLQQINDRGRNGYRVRFRFSGKSKSISLSGVTELTALTWQSHVDHLVASIEGGSIIGPSTVAWIASLSPELRKKLESVGLVEPPPEKAKAIEPITLSEFMEGYFGSKQRETKPATWIFYQHTRNRLIEFFGASKPLKSITPADARAFRKWLESSNKRDKAKDGEPAKPLALNTVKRRTGLCRQVFAQAIQDGIIQRNPFAGMTVSVRSNKERQHYVPLDVFAKVLEKAPNARWRALLVLARLGAFRIPSEAQGLKWEHIAWDAKRISVVASSKTEHHERRQVRIVPLLPAIEAELLKLFNSPEADPNYVFPDVQADSNLRTTLEKIISRAGVKQWPKLWQNLRASACTDFAKSNPSHVAAAICGHTEQVAQEHYWTVTESDLELAFAKAPSLPTSPASSDENGRGHIGGHNIGISGHSVTASEGEEIGVFPGDFKESEGFLGEENGRYWTRKLPKSPMENGGNASGGHIGGHNSDPVFDLAMQSLEAWPLYRRLGLLLSGEFSESQASKANAALKALCERVADLTAEPAKPRKRS